VILDQLVRQVRRVLMAKTVLMVLTAQQARQVQLELPDQQVQPDQPDQLDLRGQREPQARRVLLDQPDLPGQQAKTVSMD